MKVSQRDILELPFHINDRIEPHPGLVLTDTEEIEFCGEFVAIMISSQTYNDLNTFILTDDMLTTPMNKPHHELRLNIIQKFNADNQTVNKISSTIKNVFFSVVMKKVKEYLQKK